MNILACQGVRDRITKIGDLTQQLNFKNDLHAKGNKIQANCPGVQVVKFFVKPSFCRGQAICR